MNNIPLFTEQQKFRNVFIWLLLLATNGLLLFCIYEQVIRGDRVGDESVSDRRLLLAEAAVALVTVLFMQMRLETRIEEDGIYVRFFPFAIRFRRYGWEELSGCFVRQYKPLLEYGGWGIRYGVAGRALNVSGNMGIQLVLKSGSKLLIGTQKPAAVTEVLAKLRI